MDIPSCSLSPASQDPPWHFCLYNNSAASSSPFTVLGRSSLQLVFYNSSPMLPSNNQNESHPWEARGEENLGWNVSLSPLKLSFKSSGPITVMQGGPCKTTGLFCSVGVSTLSLKWLCLWKDQSGLFCQPSLGPCVPARPPPIHCALVLDFLGSSPWDINFCLLGSTEPVLRWIVSGI